MATLSQPSFQAFLKRHAVLTYYVLAFALSWGGVLLVIGGPGAIPAPSEQNMNLFPLMYLAMLVGPSVAGILLTGLVSGRAGFRDLLARLLRWRVDMRWYAVALLTAPLLMTATLFVLSLTSSLPGLFTADDRASVVLFGSAVGLGAGFFEEIGWTGFAIPRLRLRYGVLATGLIAGILWGAWHFLVNFWGSGDASGELSLDVLLPTLLFSVGVLPVYRVLMVWVYDRTTSLLVAMLMHASLTASSIILLMTLPVALPAGVSLLWYLVLTVALWLIVAAVVLFSGGKLLRGEHTSATPFM